MNAPHLAAGSQQPAPIVGQPRLYSMKFCPYAHRARLILSLKKIPHDIVNINLKNKPEWYIQVHPQGKVPSLVDADGKVLVDSITIANYLDERYPESPLYQEETKARDSELIDRYSTITDIFASCIHGKDKRPLDEVVAEIVCHLMEYEEELAKRGTIYFGGCSPGMLDVIMWPWAERAKALPLIYKQPLNVDKKKFCHLSEWIATMRQQPFVRENAGSPEQFARLIDAMNAGSVNFDSI